MQEIETGLWQHSKSGKQYIVLGTAWHSESMQQMVVYQAQYDSADLGPNPTFVRPIEMWTEQVEIEGELKPRFVKL